MKLTKEDILDQQQLMQDDFDCLLDGLDDDNVIFNKACEIITDRMKMLLDKLETQCHEM